MKGISGGLPQTGHYNSAVSKGVQQMYKRIVVSTSKKRPQKQSQPHVVVRRMHGEAADADTKGVKTRLDEDCRGQVNNEQISKSNRPSRRIDHDCGPPPQLNTIKRLAKELNGCAADLNMARGEAESDEVGWLGRQMANSQLSSTPGHASGLAKAAARKVDYKADQKVFTSLANISAVSTSSGLAYTSNYVLPFAICFVKNYFPGG